ncbi:M23 family metallopeptidase [Paenibacillus ehimensis]|uniref:M23 family metallopeptidase n=1 Tax=Paenibacillus ehimensis TaxID=79264 RepID=A0ABT8VME7_9BACL|nr:M23 family metallopeptidase [Paenibacillus ehimensis]MDO3682145.1 M23 family metallopeptidase [Paenibacillus ehimensis]MEC0211416.1 M23 family metallopeptidase [Paenibacillus ehimensis]
MDELLSPFDKWCDKREVNNQALLEIINLCGLFILLLSDDFPGTLDEKYGNGTEYVTIKHDHKAIEPGKTNNNLISRYLHLTKDSQKVSTHQRVSKGQKIAVSGNTGAATGGKDNNYHLRLDINNVAKDLPADNETIDPMLFYPNQLSSFKMDGSASNDKELHLYEDEEHSLDVLMMNHVGKEKFDAWFDNLQPHERTRTAFKQHFNISDQLLNEILKKNDIR